ncbi:glucose PTS transporter subunit EIIB, partial [Escherichia coli]|nr:glucose PTS transporter subunit EIIB [Escherichia coli]
VHSVAHCATRLRLMVNDKEKIDQERVESINKVKGAFFNSGQYQIIFGTGTVNKVYEEVSGLDIESMSASEQKKEAVKSGSAFQ